MEPHLLSTDKVLAELLKLYNSLPKRPKSEECDQARDLVTNVNQQEQERLDAIRNQQKGPHVTDELFLVLKRMQEELVYFESWERRRDAKHLLEKESIHAFIEELIIHGLRYADSRSLVIPRGNLPTAQSSSAASSSAASSSGSYLGQGLERSTARITRDDSYLPSSIQSLRSAGSGYDSGKLSLRNLAALIESNEKKVTQQLNLQNKLRDEIKRLPNSIVKLAGLITLDLSENWILELPAKFGNLTALTTLNLRSNRITELPDSIGDIATLQYLDLKENQLKSLPSTFGKLVQLVELDLSSNRLSLLPDVIGNLTSLKKLILDANDLEELPYTIHHCVSLAELRAGDNHLKSLPEALGRMTSLEVLCVHYNRLKGLPTTMASLSKLREVDASFNKLESIPESLCLATTLVKLNVAKNFSDLKSLPESIGDLENLEELDISDNQIKFLPNSFHLLANLRVLLVDGNPLEVPPRHIASDGAQAVVQHMADLVRKRSSTEEGTNNQPPRTRKAWTRLCFSPRPDKRKHDGRPLN